MVQTISKKTSYRMLTGDFSSKVFESSLKTVRRNMSREVTYVPNLSLEFSYKACTRKQRIRQVAMVK